MASFGFTPAKKKLAQGTLNFATLDVRAMLVMTNSTCATEEDKTSLAGFTTVDEYNGAGYARATLGSKTVNEDDANNWTWIGYANFTFGAAVGAGTRSIKGLLLYVNVDGTAANDYPLAYSDLTPSVNGTGVAMNVVVDTLAGLLKIT